MKRSIFEPTAAVQFFSKSKVNKMNKMKFYIHTISGDIAALDEWRADYESMDVESWHGKPAEECREEDWIKDGKLEAIDLNSFLTRDPNNLIF